MSAPRWNAQISLGNVIQMVVFIVALAAGYTRLQSSAAQNTREITRLMSQSEKHELRLHDVEMTVGTSAVQFKALSRSLDKIETRQRENSTLLRQLLARLANGGHK